MEDAAAGIREGDLAALRIDILKYKDKISELFTKIDTCIGALPNSLRGESCDSIQQSYSELKTNYPVIKSNIQSYADDLESLEQKMKDNDTNLSNLFQEFITINETKRLNIDNKEDK